MSFYLHDLRGIHASRSGTGGASVTDIRFHSGVGPSRQQISQLTLNKWLMVPVGYFVLARCPAGACG